MRISDWSSDVCSSDLTKSRIASNYSFAIDAVIDPATGAAVCRDATARAQGCIPLNLFGVGSPSPQSLSYVMGQSWRKWDIRQDAAAATLRGEPFSTWAGPVSLATGVEWRKESAVVTADALSGAGSFSTGHTVPWDRSEERPGGERGGRRGW